MKTDGSSIEIPFEENYYLKYRYVTCIGEGSFGQVDLVKSEESSEFFAIKHSDSSGYATKKVILADSEWEREYKIIMALDHPGIIKVYRFFQTLNMGLKRINHILMDYFPGINLESFINNWRDTHKNEFFRMSIEYQRIVVDNLFPIIEYIHKMGIVHRDLKTSNVMINTYEGKIKVIDFSFGGYYADEIEDDKINLVADHTKTKGTPLYMAPEIVNRNLDGIGLKNRSDLTKSDVWSVGVILYNLMKGAEPYLATSMKEFKKMMLSPPPLQFQSLYTIKPYREVVAMCLTVDYTVRPSAKQISKYLSNCIL